MYDSFLTEELVPLESAAEPTDRDTTFSGYGKRSRAATRRLFEPLITIVRGTFGSSTDSHAEDISPALFNAYIHIRRALNGRYEAHGCKYSPLRVKFYFLRRNPAVDTLFRVLVLVFLFHQLFEHYTTYRAAFGWTEIILFLIFAADAAFSAWQVGFVPYVRDPWNALFLSTVVIYFPLLMFGFTAESWPDTDHGALTNAVDRFNRSMLNIRLYLRPGFAPVYFSSLKRTVPTLLRTFLSVLPVIIMMAVVIWGFAVYGFVIFSHSCATEPFLFANFFNSVADTALSLTVCLTTANFPDVMVPTYVQKYDFTVTHDLRVDNLTRCDGLQTLVSTRTVRSRGCGAANVADFFKALSPFYFFTFFAIAQYFLQSVAFAVVYDRYKEIFNTAVVADYKYSMLHYRKAFNYLSSLPPIESCTISDSISAETHFMSTEKCRVYSTHGSTSAILGNVNLPLGKSSRYMAYTRKGGGLSFTQDDDDDDDGESYAAAAAATGPAVRPRQSSLTLSRRPSLLGAAGTKLTLSPAGSLVNFGSSVVADGCSIASMAVKSNVPGVLSVAVRNRDVLRTIGDNACGDRDMAWIARGGVDPNILPPVDDESIWYGCDGKDRPSFNHEGLIREMASNLHFVTHSDHSPSWDLATWLCVYDLLDPPSSTWGQKFVNLSRYLRGWVKYGRSFSFESMRYDPLTEKRQRRIEAFFHTLNVGGSGYLTESEFAGLHHLLQLKITWNSMPPPWIARHAEKFQPLAFLRRVGASKALDLISDFVIIGSLFYMGWHFEQFRSNWSHEGISLSEWSKYMSIELFVGFWFDLEIILKVVTLGWKRFIYNKWNRFDLVCSIIHVTTYLVTLGSFFALGSFPEAVYLVTMNAFPPRDVNCTSVCPDGSLTPCGDEKIIDVSMQVPHFIKFILFLRLLRLPKFLNTIQFFRGVIKTLMNIVPVLTDYFLALLMIYFLIATLGVDLFSGVPISPFSDYAAENYYAINFDSFYSSSVTVFTLMVVNNWHVTMNAYRAHTSVWATPLFFISVYIILVLLVMNVVTAFILDVFMVQWSVNRRGAALKNNRYVKRLMYFLENPDIAGAQFPLRGLPPPQEASLAVGTFAPLSACVDGNQQLLARHVSFWRIDFRNYADRVRHAFELLFCPDLIESVPLPQRRADSPAAEDDEKEGGRPFHYMQLGLIPKSMWMVESVDEA